MRKWNPDPESIRSFDARREVFVDGLVASVKSLPEAVFLPVSNAMLGWMMEQGHTGHPQQEEGGLEYGLNFVRHMINQGLEVAYAISLRKTGVVYLQSWEIGYEERWPWPEDHEIVVDATWHPLPVEYRSK